MTVSYQDRLSELFRQIEIDKGTTNLTILVLESIENAVHELKGQNLHEFFLQLYELTELVKNTEPKFAILIDAFYEILKLACDEEIANAKKKRCPIKKRKFLKKLRELVREKREEEKLIIENALKNVKADGREILIHDNSRTVQRVLKAFKNKGQHFRVIIAEQDPDKTEPIIEAVHSANMPFRVVPAYMISHLADHIDMVFLGGVTLKSTVNFVMDPGTLALVSQFHLMKKPIYGFMSTGKFSMWKSKKRTDVFVHTHRRKHHDRPIDFERIKFSHDRVPADLFKRIITEKGAFTPRQLEKFYKQKLKERTKSDEAFEKLLKKLS